MAEINFFNEDSNYIIPEQDKISAWIQRIIQYEQKKCGDISIITTSDDYLLQVNMQYLQKDTLTDVIAFDYNEENIVNGDIFISIERIRENAEKYRVEMLNELLRVIAHGTLHLIGYEDNTDARKLEMSKLEDKYLAMLDDVSRETDKK